MPHRQTPVTQAVFAALLLCVAHAASIAEDAPVPPLVLAGNPDTLRVELMTTIPDLMAKGHVPGLSIAVIRDGEIVWEDAFGVKNVETREAVTHETIFEAASLTKPLCAYAFMQLVEEGILSLDYPLVGYVPREKVEELLTHPLDKEGFRRDWLEEVTARQVLSHSSGMPHGEPIDPHYPLFFEPGSRYKYSAAGYYFLQIVAEHLKGRSLDEIVQEYVFDSLGMKHSSMVWRDEYERTAANGHNALGRPEGFRKYASAHAAASMYTTATDYARFVCAVLNDKGLGGDTVAEMLTPQIDVDDSDEVHWSLGFGIQRDGNGDAFWQWGDYVIFRNFTIAYKQQKTGIVYLTNSFYGLSIGPELVTHTVGGAAHGLSWLDYPSYDSPWPVFVWAILEEGVEAAVGRLPELRAKDPESFDEGDMNRLGYGLLQADQFDDAIALFRLNVDEHPLSANTYDSLAEAYMTRGGEGDIEQAVTYYREALETIPKDPSENKDFLESLRRNALEKLAELERIQGDR